MKKEMPDFPLHVRNEQAPPKQRDRWFATQPAGLDRAKACGLNEMLVYFGLSYVAGTSGITSYNSLAQITTGSVLEMLDAVVALRNAGLLDEQFATEKEPTTLTLRYLDVESEA